MYESTYVDLFATKGIEYLLVIGFLLTLILFWTYLNRPSPRVLGRMATAPAGVGGWFRLQPGLFYHQGHSWAAPEEDGVVRVGMDDFAQRLLGVPGRLDLPAVGSRVEQGERGWRLRLGSSVVDLLSPVGGQVLAVNEAVLHSPHLINDDPYGEGWLLKVQVPNLSANLKNLLSGSLATAWMRDTVQALRRRMSGELGLAMQDGGVPVVGIARNLSPENWEQIAQEFLMNG